MQPPAAAERSHPGPACRPGPAAERVAEGGKQEVQLPAQRRPVERVDLGEEPVVHAEVARRWQAPSGWHERVDDGCQGPVGGGHGRERNVPGRRTRAVPAESRGRAAAERLNGPLRATNSPPGDKDVHWRRPPPNERSLTGRLARQARSLIRPAAHCASTRHPAPSCGWAVCSRHMNASRPRSPADPKSAPADPNRPRRSLPLPVVIRRPTPPWGSPPGGIRMAHRSTAAGPRSARTIAGWSHSCWRCSPMARRTGMASSASSPASASRTGRSTWPGLPDLARTGEGGAGPLDMGDRIRSRATRLPAD